MSYLAGLGWVLPGSFRILLLSFLFFFFWVVLATDVASMACKLISFSIGWAVWAVGHFAACLRATDMI